MSKEHSTSIRATRGRRPRLAVAVIAFVAAVIPAAASATPSAEHLAAHGWSCGLTPANVTPTRIVCGTPGVGRPFPGNPDPSPTYRLWLFEVAGEFVGKVHFVRADLYAGQPCKGGDPYVFRTAIGYYECLDLVDR